MPDETEVVSCPACRHLLRVPADWLGTAVECPECRAMFRAPVRDGGRLTEPELLSGPGGGDRPPRPPASAAVVLPGIVLILLGLAGAVVDLTVTSAVWSNPGAMKADLKKQFADMRKQGMWADDPAEDRDQLDDERAGQAVDVLRVAMPGFAAVALGMFAGGLAVVLRRGRSLATLGFVLGCLHLPLLVCVPGAVVGVWGLAMVWSPAGRDHFA